MKTTTLNAFADLCEQNRRNQRQDYEMILNCDGEKVTIMLTNDMFGFSHYIEISDLEKIFPIKARYRASMVYIQREIYILSEYYDALSSPSLEDNYQIIEANISTMALLLQGDKFKVWETASDHRGDVQVAYRNGHRDFEKLLEFRLNAKHFQRVLGDIGKGLNDKLCIGVDSDRNLWGMFNAYTLKGLTHKPRTQAHIRPAARTAAIVSSKKLYDFVFSYRENYRGILAGIKRYEQSLNVEDLYIGVGTNNRLFVEPIFVDEAGNESTLGCYLFDTQAVEHDMAECMNNLEEFGYEGSGNLTDTVEESVQKLESDIAFTVEEEETLKQWRLSHLRKCEESGSVPSTQLNKWWMDYFSEQLANSIEVDLEQANEILSKASKKQNSNTD